MEFEFYNIRIKAIMNLRIFDSSKRKKIILKPLEKNHVKLYVCGITSYDYCHIGHARSALVFDMIVKYLRYRDWKVTYVRNFTDIDDKIINRANEQSIEPQVLAEKFIKAFHEDMAELGVDSPDAEPRATEHLPEIIELIEKLIDSGYAYSAEGDVYFAVEKFKNYGALSGRNIEDLMAGARISVNDKKNNPMDFALWKSSKPGEPTWDSPWGPGRPGWHIECSAMSRKFLGDTFDIHGGGKDLSFPHHENELAQSEAASGKKYANSWIHHGFVTIKDEKMSKSLKNFLTIREVLEDYPSEVLRLFVFSAQYRKPLDYSIDAMNDSRAGLDRLYNCLAAIEQLKENQSSRQEQTELSQMPKKAVNKLKNLADQFNKAMENDFNTAQAIGHLFDGVKALNQITQHLAANCGNKDVELLAGYADSIREMAGIMGLLIQEPLQYQKNRQEQLGKELNIDSAEIERLIGQRNKAREQKDWARADEIRDILLKLRIDLHDNAEGTSWLIR
jgi:cysteinyl-tRNA synthetase